MKTIRNKFATSEIKRVSDSIADSLVKSGKFLYCDKQTWKKQVRDANKPAETK